MTNVHTKCNSLCCEFIIKRENSRKFKNQIQECDLSKAYQLITFKSVHFNIVVTNLHTTSGRPRKFRKGGLKTFQHSNLIPFPQQTLKRWVVTFFFLKYREKKGGGGCSLIGSPKFIRVNLL